MIGVGARMEPVVQVGGETGPFRGEQNPPTFGVGDREIKFLVVVLKIRPEETRYQRPRNLPASNSRD
jgi:hypothetical protein